MIPKVVFKIADPEYDLNYMLQFLLSKNKQLKERVLSEYPILKTKLEGYTRINEPLKEYIDEYYRNNLDEIKNRLIEFNNEWNKISDKFLVALSEIMKTDWPKEHQEIEVFVSIVPICPRNLKKYSLSIYYKSRWMKKIIAHEITHFLYFKKWKEIFPNTKDKECEAPHIIWYLSEILDFVILMNPKTKDLVEANLKTSYPLLFIENTNILDHMYQLYTESLSKKESFEIFLKKAYEEILKHKDSYQKTIASQY